MRVAYVLLVWILGLAAGAVFLVRVGLGLGCHPAPECTWEDNRWWHPYLILWIALGPGIAATGAWWLSRLRDKRVGVGERSV